jgi:anti-sigma factor RsiW
MSANHETHGEGRNDLDWLAFQYVAGELSVEDEEQIEARLATEPEVAEAVANAVVLGEAVSSVFSGAAAESVRTAESSPRGVTADRSTVGRTVSVVTAACVVVAALLISFRGEEPSRDSLATNSESSAGDAPGSSVPSPDDNSLLLETWTVARESVAAMDSVALAESVPVDSAESRIDSASDVPDWLFVAVELSYDSALGNSNGSVLEN